MSLIQLPNRLLEYFVPFINPHYSLSPTDKRIRQFLGAIIQDLMAIKNRKQDELEFSDQFTLR